MLVGMPFRPPVPLSAIDDDIAKEKGRLLAAQNIARDPEARKRVIDMFGEDYVKRRYPEAFAKSPFFTRLIDKIRFVGMDLDRVD